MARPSLNVADMKPREIAPLAPRKAQPKIEVSVCECGRDKSQFSDQCLKCRTGISPIATNLKGMVRATGWCQCGNTASWDGFCRHCRPVNVKRQRVNTVAVAKLAARLPKSRKGMLKLHRKEMWKPYGKRLEVCERIGFKSYTAYLESGLWAGIRIRVLREQRTCCRCGNTPNQVHHAAYTHENLTGKSLEFLYAVCRPCHERGEFDTQGAKRTLAECNAWLGVTGQ